jgi:hypothetical protein
MQRVVFENMALRSPKESETTILTELLYEPLYTQRLLQVLQRGIFVHCRDEVLLHSNKILIVYFDTPLIGNLCLICDDFISRV